MITNIILEYFKCFRKLEVNPRLITVFIGPNGTGKSSVLQAILLLKQSIGSTTLNLSGSHLEFAGFADIFSKIDRPQEALRIRFGGIDTSAVLASLGFEDIRYSYSADFSENTLVTRCGEITFRFAEKSSTISVQGLGDAAREVEVGQHIARLQPSRQIASIVTLSEWRQPPGVQFNNGFTELLDSANADLRALKSVPAIRGFGRYQYQLGHELVAEIHTAQGLSRQEEQSATHLAYTSDLDKKRSDWAERVTGTGFMARVVPSQAVAIEAVATVGRVNIQGEGSGTNALTLLLLQLAYASQRATVMIEEPEIHLHPRAQAELASLLAEVAKAENKQIIMTTHSEHILGRLLTLVAEKKLSRDELAIYAFEKDRQGACTANEIDVAADGRVKGGLKDFFETDLNELDRYIKALKPAE